MCLDLDWQLFIRGPNTRSEILWQELSRSLRKAWGGSRGGFGGVVTGAWDGWGKDLMLAQQFPVQGSIGSGGGGVGGRGNPGDVWGVRS